LYVFTCQRVLCCIVCIYLSKGTMFYCMYLLVKDTTQLPSTSKYIQYNLVTFDKQIHTIQHSTLWQVNTYNTIKGYCVVLYVFTCQRVLCCIVCIYLSKGTMLYCMYLLVKGYYVVLYVFTCQRILCCIVCIYFILWQVNTYNTTQYPLTSKYIQYNTVPFDK
jgi:hypothetical protein